MEVSENSLFIDHSNAQSSIDWSVIIKRIIEKSYFKDSTQKRLKDSLSDLDVIITHFNKIDQIQEDFDHYLFIHDKLKSNVSAEFNINQIFASERSINDQNVESIHEIYQFIEFFKEFAKDLGGHSIEPELIRQIDDFRLVVNKEGDINYSGHPRFRSIMNEIHDCEHEARIKVRSVISKLAEQDLLQHDQHDIVNERYVVAVKSDTYRSDIGRIINRSARLRTLYIEPPSMREFSDRRLLLMSKLQEQVYFFERENIDCLIKFRPIINLILAEIYDFDFFFAKTFFCRIHSLNRPDLVAKKEIKFQDLFHPLIKTPVKNSFHLTEKTDNLVISGPNTGGKSVFMKAVALSYMFVSKGIFVPAHYATLFWPDHVFYIGNLNENIEEGLSSFSGEIQALLNIMDAAKDKSCILFADELFNSTSSEEASAIACAILDQLQELSESIGFVSTHHTSLKRIAKDKENYEVCHFGFDEARNRPNYLLQWGESGDSRAISVLKNAESPFIESIVSKIGRFMDQSYVDYAKLQDELRQRLGKFESEKDAFDKMKQKLDAKFARAENEIKLFREREQKRTEQKMQSIIAKANKLVKEIKGGTKAPLNEIYELKRELPNENPKLEDKLKNKKQAELSELEIGQTYFSAFANGNVELKEINDRKKQVQVIIGNKAIWHKLEDLFVTHHISPSYSKKQAPVEQRGIVESQDVPIEHDCRGMRLEVFQKYFEDVSQSLFTEDVPYLNIIHGHGTGVLKSWLRKHLDKHRTLKYEIPDGNDGSTIIKLG